MKDKHTHKHKHTHTHTYERHKHTHTDTHTQMVPRDIHTLRLPSMTSQTTQVNDILPLPNIYLKVCYNSDGRPALSAESLCTCYYDDSVCVCMCVCVCVCVCVWLCMRMCYYDVCVCVCVISHRWRESCGA